MRVVPLVVLLALLQAGIRLPISLTSPVAAAATITVNSNEDTTIPADGKCTLREALFNVQVRGQGGGGECAPGSVDGTNNTINFSLPNPSTIMLDTTKFGALLISENVTINGPGATALAVDGHCTTCDGGVTPSDGVTVFSIVPGRTVAITGMTVQHGNSQGTDAGAIFDDQSVLTVQDCVVRNSAGGFGGGIGTRILGTGDVTVQRSTLTGNQASIEGGGLFYSQFGTLTITNSTVVGNASAGSAPSGNGGGVAADLSFGATATITSATIAQNTAQGLGGGLYSNTVSTTLVNTLVAGNTGGASGGPDIQNDAGISPGAGGTNNLIGNGDNGNLGGTALTNGMNSNQVGTTAQPIDPLLAAQLAANGSANGTQTLALLPGSLAINTGATGGSVPTTDQRGVNRVGAPDIGAFESRGFTLGVTAGNNQSAVVTQPFATALAVTVMANSAGEPVQGGAVTFTAPSSGASATFTANPATIAANGQASVAATANVTVGAYTVTATAQGATAGQFSLTNIAPTITLAPATLPNGAAEQPYSQTVTAAGTGSTAPFTFAVTAGALPTGVALDTNTGVLSGTPTQAGGFPFTITATDANHFTGSQQYTLTVTAPTITLSPTTLPAGVKGVAYQSTALTASGGVAPFTFAITAGALPDGLALNATSGQIAGTPTATGTFTFTVTATDANQFTGSQQYTVTVTAAPLVSIAVTPANATLKVGGTQQYTATGTYADGSTLEITGAVAWSPASGAVVMVDRSGKGTAMGPGSATITATQGSVSGQTSVTVSGGTSVGVAPVSAPSGRPGAAAVTPPSGAPAPIPKPAPTGR